MGIFPMNFKPKHSICSSTGQDKENWDYEKRDRFFESLKTKFKVTLMVYGQLDKMIEIDEWIGKNIKGQSYFDQGWPPPAPVWMQCWYFDDADDAMRFKLVWS